MNKTSLAKLNTCHPNIIRLALAVDKVFPIQCICGHRNEKDQDDALRNGYSKLRFPNSKHNKTPSHAGDFVPDPDRNPATVEWGDIKSFEMMCLVFEQKADELGIKIRLGRDFSFKDYPHIELV
jgi:peptidoglycan L-alanyl-D-glutamate endopeptidase CwlK